MFALALGFLKSWKGILAMVIVVAVAYGGFAIYRFVDELHDEKANIQRDLDDAKIELANKEVLLNQALAKASTLESLVTRREEDLAASKLLNDQLEGETELSQNRIRQIERQLARARAETRERAFSGDPVVSDAQVEDFNRTVNCQFAAISGDACE